MVPSGFTVPGWQALQLVLVAAWLGGGAPWQVPQAACDGPPVHCGAWLVPPTPSVALKFRAKGGNTVAATVFICALTRGEEKEFILQCLPESPPAGGEARQPEGGADKATKHKLDCALRLAQTVALDFNNVLTSILGHTTHVLSQMEAGHPWRDSLLEVVQGLLERTYRMRTGVRDVGRFGKGLPQDELLPPSVYANLFEAITAAVYLDGGLQATIDTYASAAQAQSVLYSASGLSTAIHTLTIVAAGATT